MDREALNKPLKFGDIEQINALNEIQEEIRKQEEESIPLKDGLLKKYNIFITYSIIETKEVYAHSKNEANLIAKEMDLDELYDPEITNIRVVEIK